jgi:hypothetical protein
MCLIAPLILAGCLEGEEEQNGPATQAAAVTQEVEAQDDPGAKLPALSANQIETIRSRPETMASFFSGFKTWAKGYKPAFFSLLSEAEFYAIYSAYVAYSMAPYGNSVEIHFDELLEEEQLDCDNYVRLTFYLYQTGEGITSKDVTFKFVGWEGGAIGNHAQIFVVSPHRSILLDPTIGIAAFTDFDSVASGRPLAKSAVVDFSTRNDLAEYKAHITGALVQGTYKPSDLLYYYADFADYTAPQTNFEGWPTPGAYALRSRSQ